MSESKPTFNFMLVGRTGYGKSATGNTLIDRRNVFKASYQTGSCIKEPQLECGEFDENIKIVDTPGLNDSNVDMAVTLDHICNAMALLPDGFDALLLVMKYGERCTKEVVEVISALRATFGEVFAKEYCIIVMTHGENFDMDMSDEDYPDTFDDYCKNITGPPEFLSLLVDCEYRVVLFYNKNKAKREESVKSLVTLAQTMKHRSQRYNSDMFAKFSKERNKYVISLKLPQPIPPIQEKLSILKAELEKSMAEPDAKSDLELKMKSQQLLDTIEEESNGTSLTDGLKNEVRGIISTMDTLSSQKQERQKMSRKLNDLVDTIKIPPSRSKIIVSGLAALGLGVVGGVCLVASVINPAMGALGTAPLLLANEFKNTCLDSINLYTKERKIYDRALSEMDKLKIKWNLN